MRNFFTLSVLGMMLVSSLQAQSWDWAEEIARLNPEIIDSVKTIGSGDEVRWTQSCMIYYHQPLQHDNPSLGTLPLRAVFTAYTFGDFKDRMVQMSIGGYNLSDQVISYPNINSTSIDGVTAVGEISYHYEGHLLRPEHRYFGKSCPENPWETLSYCEAKEAAADFHALAEAVKKVFKGKWAITGVSKGGMCAAIQHAYYPDDADCFVPYVAPILTGMNDMRVLDQCMTEPWTPEMREETRHIITEMLNRPAVYSYYEKNRSYGPEQDVECRCAYLESVFRYFGNSLMYDSRSVLSGILKANQSYLKENGLEDYTDAMLAYFHENKKIVIKLEGSSFELWKLVYWDKNDQSATRAFNGINKDLWSGTQSGFIYQTLRELGYYGLKWDYFYDTQAKIDSVNTLWQSHVSNVMVFQYGNDYCTIEYNPELMNLVRQQTASATKPLLYLYGGDDLWTGGRIDAEYVNGENVRCYILPKQNHRACINNMTDTDKQEEIWAFLDTIFNANPDAIENLKDAADDVNKKVMKYFDGEKFVIDRAGRKYNVAGQQIK